MMTIHPLGQNGFLVEINSDYIQALYNERDAAIERNRELNLQLEARMLLIKSIASRMNELEQAQEASETMVSTLRELVSDLLVGLQDCWDNEYSLEALQGLRTRVKEVLS